VGAARDRVSACQASVAEAREVAAQCGLPLLLLDSPPVCSRSCCMKPVSKIQCNWFQLLKLQYDMINWLQVLHITSCASDINPDRPRGWPLRIADGLVNAHHVSASGKDEC